MFQSNIAYVSDRQRKYELTRHAEKRCAQRGLCKDVVPLLTVFGDASHDGYGGIRYVMTDQALERLKRVIGRNQTIDRLAGVYAVVSASDGQVITLGHRYL
ncbi:MAG: hypothetical protein RLZZ352_1665 [Pseudomonadota bacterium]|jgi:hypothetical protein